MDEIELFSFPSDNTPDLFADWLELVTSITGKPWTKGDFQGALRRRDVSDPDRVASETWNELERRSRLYCDVWSLTLDHGQLRPAEQIDSISAAFHKFLCALSLGGDSITNSHRMLFEYCVSHIISAISRHESIRLGAPRGEGVPRSLPDAICYYANKSDTEPTGRRPEATDQDLGLDVVTWIPFSDGRGGYIQFVGQCATGKNWYDKIDDLKLEWWRDYVDWLVDPIRFFATPIVIPRVRWRRASKAAGMLLDRPRLLELERKERLSGQLADKLLNALASILDEEHLQILQEEVG